jgi:hypothetical protein
LGLEKIPAHPEHDFRAVEADRFYAETNLPGGRFRKRELVQLEDFGAAGLMEADNPYHI